MCFTNRVCTKTDARFSSAPSPARETGDAIPDVNLPARPVGAGHRMSADLRASIAAHNLRVSKTIMEGTPAGTALTDGALDDRERQSLMARVDAATELPKDEKRRLSAELVAQASTLGRVTDWMKRLKDLESTDHERLADMLVAEALASAAIDQRQRSTQQPDGEKSARKRRLLKGPPEFEEPAVRTRTAKSIPIGKLTSKNDT